MRGGKPVKVGDGTPHGQCQIRFRAAGETDVDICPREAKLPLA